MTAARRTALFLKRLWRARPRIGVILGSGLGEVVERVKVEKKIPFSAIPFFPRPSVRGHSGTLHLCNCEGVPVAVLEGRVHLYEGFKPSEVVFPVRALALAGIEVLFATCAAGGIAPKALPGSLMIFSDHLNFQAASPLAGPDGGLWGERFVDLSVAYDPHMRREAGRAAGSLGLKCFEGVYAAVLGPHYETPAEIRALKRLGADAVGMSTVLETIAARQLGVRVLGVAVITNRAAGLSRRPLSHLEVIKSGKSAARDLGRLIEKLIPGLVGAGS